MADTAYTIESYLRGKCGFDIDDAALATVLYDRNLDSGEAVDCLTRRDLELCTADLYMWYLTTPSKRASVKDADGNWSHETGSSEMSVSDKRALREWASAIYAKYGENVGAKKKIKFYTRGIRL